MFNMSAARRNTSRPRKQRQGSQATAKVISGQRKAWRRQAKQVEPVTKAATDADLSRGFREVVKATLSREEVFGLPTVRLLALQNRRLGLKSN